VLARVRQITGARVPLIGIGGIDSGTAAIAKLEAGATLLQLYTGLVYEGPSLLGRMKRDILSLIERENLTSIGELTGRRASEWATRNLDA
jgi:dihydroorotate dehydrogenase